MARFAKGSARGQRHHHRFRRHGFFSPKLFWQHTTHSKYRSSCAKRFALHGFSHHSVVFAFAREFVDRSQSSRCRYARRIQLEHGFSKHARRHHSEGSNNGRSIAARRLCNIVCRQVAPCSNGRVHCSRPAHQLAVAKRFRSLLWIFEWRDRSVLS